MRITGLFADEDAVSPVIGVILMVAITVILAAVIASFVLGLGNQPTETPQVNFEFDYNGSALEVTHNGGATLNGSEVELRGTHNEGDPIEANFQDHATLTEVSTGNGILVRNIESDYDVTVTYVPHGGGSTAPLASDEGPDA